MDTAKQRIKQRLRKGLKAKRMALTQRQVARRSRSIAERTLQVIDWRQVRNLHTYLPFKHQNEVDTTYLLQAVWEQHPRVATATWQKTKREFSAVWVRQNGITKPVPYDQQFDVVVVPCLGFNDQCHRLGSGGGYYDRFLLTQPKAFTVGLCYESARCDFDAEPHDIPLSGIMTEKLWRARSS